MSYSNSARRDSCYHVCYFQDDMLMENAAKGNAALSKCSMGNFLFVVGRYEVNKLFILTLHIKWSEPAISSYNSQVRYHISF